jgi:Xaa-Pro aminopeptidase
MTAVSAHNTFMLRAKTWAIGVLLVLSTSAALTGIEKEPLSEYAARRARVAEEIKGSALILFGSPDPDLVKFKQESNFYYLTGFDQFDAVLLIDATVEPFDEVLFVRPRDPSQERWTGRKTAPGAEGEHQTGIRSVQPSSELSSRVAKTLQQTKKIFTLRGDRDSQDQIKKLAPTAELQSAGPVIAKLRLRKSPTELALLEKTIDITLRGHEAAARTIAPNVWEYEVEAALEYEFRRRGAERPAFPSIVGSGPNGTTLHYNSNSRQMRGGELVVVDVGSEYSGYAGDVTRTYPVSGKFNTRQREIYQIVLEAQKAALEKARPGARMQDVHQAAFSYIQSKGFGGEFPHGTSHHVGLEVHDVGAPDRLEPGMVITVEPGIYLDKEELGVRIEDMIVITSTGYRLLSDFPKEIAEIEALMARSSGNSRR